VSGELVPLAGDGGMVDVEVVDGVLAPAGLTVHDAREIARWDVLRDEFLFAKARVNANTAEAYARDILQYEDFLDDFDVEPLIASRLAVERWAQSLTAAGRAPSTVRRKLAAVTSCYRFGVDLDALQRNPAAGVERPEISNEPETDTLAERDVAQLLAAARADSLPAYALLALLYFNGLRVSQALSARVEGLGLDDGHRVLRVTQKRRSGRVPVPLRATAARHSVEQLAERRGEGPLFVVERDEQQRAARGWWKGSSAAEPMTRGYVWWLLQRLCADAGVPAVGPHSLRHAFVTHSLEAGVPIHVVQDHAQHRSIDTTQRYNRRRRRHETQPGALLESRLDG
jgi:site-specific recombinase XerD